MSFLRLPYEIRLSIYEDLFGCGVALVDGGRQDTGEEAQNPSMIPTLSTQTRVQQRSAQMLRTCKTILAEARPVLYSHTVFRSTFQAFAGRLPTHLTTGHPSAPEIRHLDWHLSCDLLKKFDPAEVRLCSKDVQSLQTVQLVCQAGNWRDSLCGEWCDRETFVRGRQQVIDFARILRANMANGAKQFTLVEDVKYLPRGRVVLRIFRGRKILTDHVCISNGLEPGPSC